MRTYQPEPPPRPKAGQSLNEWADELVGWLERDSSSVQQAANADSDGVRFTILHSAPTKTNEGDLVVADGSDYDPGDGQGVYLFIDGAWVKVGPFQISGISSITAGTATLVNGAVTVNLSSVTASSMIFAFHQDDTSSLPSTGNPSSLWCASRSAGASFTINASGGSSDDNPIAWLVLEP